MHVFADDTQALSRWIRDEVELERETAKGSRGKAVRRVQEWLNLHGIGLVVDEDFGPVTERCLKRFQEQMDLPVTGTADRVTFATLVQPMLKVLHQRPAGGDMARAMTAYAQAHLAVHPREIGGQNRGPWVRLYMQGNEGIAFPWCAGFVTFLLEQASQTLGRPMPIGGSFSCDSLAAQAEAADRFLGEGAAPPDRLPPGTLFLVHRTATDWTHTGMLTEALTETFDTVEGNTNDEGSREGFEVCARSRGYKSKDFILLE